MRILFLTLLLLVSLGANAHSDMTYSHSKGNIHTQFKTGWSEFETYRKIFILEELAYRLAKTQGYKREHIYIYFDHDYTKADTSYYALGYGKFTYWDYENSNKDISKNGIKLIVRDRDLNISELLNLINYAFKNVNFIKSAQKDLIMDLHSYSNGIRQYDTLSTISATLVKKYLLTTDTVVGRIIKEKIYRNLKRTELSGEIDYYYQYNKYHFYNTVFSADESLKEEEKDILVVDNILEIVGGIRDGHFIFINDSVFYYIAPLQYKVTGPYTINNTRVGRRPIEKYLHNYTPVNMFTFYFEEYAYKKKAAFFPDSNLVISDYGRLENEFVNSLSKKEGEEENNSYSNTKLYIILLILALSITLNSWLLIKNEKR